VSSERTFLFRFLASIVLPLMNLLGKYVVHGTEHVPKTGAFVLAPNHITNFDPLVVALALWKAGRAPRFFAKASLFKVPVLGAALRGTGQILVERSGTSARRDALAAASQIVDNGFAVILYPEGTLTRDPDLWPMRGKTGAVRMALGQGIPVIPVAHWGAQRILPRYSKKLSLFPRKRVDIRFGAAVDLSRFEGSPLDITTLNQATDEVMDAITALVEQLRGEEAPAERWNPAHHGQTETGRFE
jgi:1-acyl-sn-glycerol-3-phosphate acyltransferase